jgi:hypothetical protein
VTIVRNGAVAVPEDYVGMHFRSWPLFDAAYWATASQPFPAAAAPAPSQMSYGNYRTHDSVYAWWYRIEKTKGLYDWTDLDVLISTHRASGKTVNYCLYGVPNWYLAEGNPNKGGPHARSCYPDAADGLTGLNAFVAALMTRYNTPAGAWRAQDPTLGNGINYLELWNEPEFGSPDGFWIGTSGQFIDLAHNVCTAAKAVDPSIPIISPGFSGANHLQTFLRATGAINTSASGLSLVDAIAMHVYITTPPGIKFGAWKAEGYEVLNMDRGLRSVMAAAGASEKPIYITETGLDYTAGTAELNIMNAQTPAWRYAWWARLMMVGAALGYKCWDTYAWDTPYACTPMTDPQGVAKAVNDVHINVAGKTIKNAWYYSGGEVGLQFTDGVSFVV